MEHSFDKNFELAIEYLCNETKDYKLPDKIAEILPGELDKHSEYSTDSPEKCKRFILDYFLLNYIKDYDEDTIKSYLLEKSIYRRNHQNASDNRQYTGYIYGSTHSILFKDSVLHFIRSGLFYTIFEIVQEKTDNNIIDFLKIAESIKNFISLIKKCVVKIKDNEYCLYLKIYQHSKKATSDEIIKYMTENKQCNNHAKNLWNCPYNNADDACGLCYDTSDKTHEWIDSEIEKIKKSLLDKRLIIEEKSGEYRINE